MSTVFIIVYSFYGCDSLVDDIGYFSYEEALSKCVELNEKEKTDRHSIEELKIR